jgi:hypothetical protein
VFTRGRQSRKDFVMGRFQQLTAALAAAALLIAGGGAYALASSSGGTITVCVMHTGGRLYKAKTCAKRDSKLTWNKQGAQGVQGVQGPQGVEGAQGLPGASGQPGANGTSVTSTALPSGNADCPNGGTRFAVANGTTFACNGAPGPGATTFSMTFPQGTVSTTLATLSNGIVVQGTCNAGNVVVGLTRQTAGDEMQASGIGNTGGALAAVDFDATSGEVVTGASASSVDLDLLARDATVGGKFAHIDVHGVHGSPCAFWGMIIPSG